MGVTEDRKFTKKAIFEMLENAVGKTLGEIDREGSHQFDRTLKSAKITGIAGDVIEQSLFGYARDSIQGCDIEIDGTLVELKTTGVRVPLSKVSEATGKSGDAYKVYYTAKEGISVTRVTIEPIQQDFWTSHFWDKARRMLIVFYDYQSYEVVPAITYSKFPIVGYCLNTFSPSEEAQLKNDWEIVRNYLNQNYKKYPLNKEERLNHLVGFTGKLRPNLLLIELVPSFKKNKNSNSFQSPRYRLKKTFVDTIVTGHFNKSRAKHEISLKESFSSFAELDARCHALSETYKGMTCNELRNELNIKTSMNTKSFSAECILKMFNADCKRLNQIIDFNRAGIICKTITLDSKGRNTEDMKLQHIDFKEWAERDIDFEDSNIYEYFMEHSLLCPVFIEWDSKDKGKTTFEGFKRFAFNDDFIEGDVKRMWEDSRRLIHTNTLKWEYEYDKNGRKIKNNSGSWRGAPNLPKRKDYTVFFRGGANTSSDKDRTEIINNIKILPQYFWLRGSYVADELKKLSYL